jgi:hypothetical protein
MNVPEFMRFAVIVLTIIAVILAVIVSISRK